MTQLKRKNVRKRKNQYYKESIIFVVESIYLIVVLIFFSLFDYYFQFHQ
jgi:hypothetical protein